MSRSDRYIMEVILLPSGEFKSFYDFLVSEEPPKKKYILPKGAKFMIYSATASHLYLVAEEDIHITTEVEWLLMSDPAKIMFTEMAGRNVACDPFEVEAPE